jgi:hypothetical protein
MSIFFFHILTFHNCCSSSLHRTLSISSPRCLQSVVSSLYFAIYLVSLPYEYTCHWNILLLVHKNFILLLPNVFYFATDSTFSATEFPKIYFLGLLLTYFSYECAILKCLLWLGIKFDPFETLRSQRCRSEHYKCLTFEKSNVSIARSLSMLLRSSCARFCHKDALKVAGRKRRNT